MSPSPEETKRDAPAPADAAEPLARYRDLDGRCVFVSGGASGIGAALVAAFCRQGAKTYFVDIQEEAGLALAEKLGAETGNAPVFLRSDVTDAAALQAGVARAQDETGDLYALVNNAAHDQRHAAQEVTPEAWDRIVAVNLKHQFFAAQAAAPLIAGKGGGSIVNFGSIAPTQGIERLSVYSTCKAGVFGLTRSLAREYGAEGVRVNSVVPGAILTERQRALWISPEDEAALIERQCLKRAMAETDVAEMVLFLASNASAGCTGQEFRVDGGLF